MKTRYTIKTKVGLWMVMTLLSMPSARSENTIAWYWNNTAIVANPSDPVVLTGTITNYSAQEYVIPQAAGAAALWGKFTPLYSTFWQIDFYDKTVPANGSLFFTFSTLTPLGGSVSPGIYPAEGADIDVGYGFQPALNTFQVIVVPEPAVLSVSAVGWTAFLASRAVRHFRRGRGSHGRRPVA